MTTPTSAAELGALYLESSVLANLSGQFYKDWYDLNAELPDLGSVVSERTSEVIASRDEPEGQESPIDPETMLVGVRLAALNYVYHQNPELARDEWNRVYSTLEDNVWDTVADTVENCRKDFREDLAELERMHNFKPYQLRNIFKDAMTRFDKDPQRGVHDLLTKKVHVGLWPPTAPVAADRLGVEPVATHYQASSSSSAAPTRRTSKAAPSGRPKVRK